MCRFTGPAGTTTVKDYLESTFDYEYSFRWPCVAISVAYVIFFRLLGAAALRYLNFLKR